MRKKLIVPLIVLLIAVLFVGTRFANQPKYSDAEIQEYNESLSRIDIEELEMDLEEEDQTPDETSTSPVIRPKYPQGLKDKETVTADRVYLEFFSENEIVSVTANGRAVPNTTDATITTSGTYEIVATDDQGQKSTFTFTLIKE